MIALRSVVVVVFMFGLADHGARAIGMMQPQASAATEMFAAFSFLFCIAEALRWE